MRPRRARLGPRRFRDRPRAGPDKEVRLQSAPARLIRIWAWQSGRQKKGNRLSKRLQRAFGAGRRIEYDCAGTANTALCCREIRYRHGDAISSGRKRCRLNREVVRRRRAPRHADDRSVEFPRLPGKAELRLVAEPQLIEYGFAYCRAHDGAGTIEKTQEILPLSDVFSG